MVRSLADLPVVAVEPRNWTALLLAAPPGAGVEDAAHEFAKGCLKAACDSSSGVVVENGVAPVDMDFGGGRRVQEGSWFVRVKARDVAEWERLQARAVRKCEAVRKSADVDPAWTALETLDRIAKANHAADPSRSYHRHYAELLDGPVGRELWRQSRGG